MVKRESDEVVDAANSRQKLDTSTHVSFRAVITNRCAATLLGEDGDTIRSIQTDASVDIDISDQIRGAINRILTVSGNVENVSQAFEKVSKALLRIALHEEEQSGELTIKLAVSHIYIGAIIGAGGYRLRQIIDTSKTQIYVSEFCLPLSSERAVSITGNASGVALAIAEIAKEYLKLKTKAETATSHAFVPVSMFGRYGHPESFRLTKPHDTMMTPSNPYGIAPASFDASAAETNGTNEPNGQPGDGRAGPARGAVKEKLTQQIFIPNDMVGSIIGKQGSKINEIRQLSGSHIKINEPDATRPSERQITVEGTQEQNQLALYMLYQRLESEKRRQ